MPIKRKPPAGNVERPRPHGNSIRGVVTNKRGRTVQYGSFAERRLILALDQDPTVVDFSSRPERIEYIDRAGVVRSHVPHFIVWRRDGKVEWHHVVLSRDPSKEQPQLEDEERAARYICRQRGWQYKVHTDNTLLKGTPLANLQVLEYFEPRCYRDEEAAEAVLEYLKDGGQVSYKVLQRAATEATSVPAPVVMETVCHMLWHGQIQTDLNTLLFFDGELSPTALISACK